MNSTCALKESADEVGAPSCGGDNTRNPISNSVKKLREFWTRWQSRENKVLTGSLNDHGSTSEGAGSFSEATPHHEEHARARVPWRSEGGSSRSTLDRRPLPRCRRLRELVRKVSSRFSGSVNDAFEDDDDFVVVAAAGTATAAQATSAACREPDFGSSEEYSLRDPFLRDEGPSEFSCHAFSSVLSHHSVTESTIEAYADVSLEMAHRLKSRRTPVSQPCNTVLPSNLFRRSSLETSRTTSYRRLRSISADDDEAP